MGSIKAVEVNLEKRFFHHGIFIFSIILILLIGGIALNRAWVGDDSYITFRVIDNINHGYGIRWNINERVQVFTHPLWMLILALLNAITKEIYLTSIFLSLLLTIATAIILFRLEMENPAVCLGLLALASSSAFMDYSTSGLENPLSHILLMIFLFGFIRESSREVNNQKKLLFLSFIAGFGCLNRLDYCLIYLPPLVFMVFQSKRKWRSIMQIVLGFSPVIIWMVFSIYYYGFPFPNTFYAKVANWLSNKELIEQGWHYIEHTLKNDPVTGLILVSGLMMSFINRTAKRSAISLGAVLYIAYLLWIGGDFMEGRFLTGIFLIFTVQLVHFDIPLLKVRQYGWIVPILIIGNLFASVPTFARSWDFIEPWKDGIVNERFFYFPTTGLFRNGVFNLEPDHPWVADGKALRKQCERGACVYSLNSVGFSGYYAGPKVYIVDRLGLGSALIARIPPIYTPKWRIGHFEREIPDGYVDYLISGKIHLIADPSIREYVLNLNVLTQQPLTAQDRLRIIVSFWLGRYDYLINTDLYRYPN